MKTPRRSGPLDYEPLEEKKLLPCEVERGLASHCKDKPFEISNDEGDFRRAKIQISFVKYDFPCEMGGGLRPLRIDQCGESQVLEVASV
jgi:hypothetical protein